MKDILGPTARTAYRVEGDLSLIMARLCFLRLMCLD